MKKMYLLFGTLFAFSMISPPTTAQHLNANGQKVPHSERFFVKAPSTSIFPETLDSARAITELNTPDADAYPYISSDGLRLYFTNNSTGSNGLFMASRPSINSQFGTKVSVDAGFPLGSFGCWLTNDELEIYFSSGSGNLYHATRPSISDPFSTPVQVQLLGKSDFGFIVGPSITPDGQELYLFSDLNGIANIFKFANTGQNQFTLTDSLDSPTGLSFSPGQLSKDGLEYYLCLGSGATTKKLYKYTRATLSANFTIPTILSSTINATNNLCTQPSMSANSEVLVWVGNYQDAWSTNELWTAKQDNIGIDENLVAFDKVNMYPMPAKNVLNVEFELINRVEVVFTLYDILGKKHFEIESNYDAGANKQSFNFEPFLQGIYFLNMQSEGRQQVFKIVKAE